VVFPLEVLSIINVLAALFHLTISFLVLILGFLIINHYINWTIILFPLVLLPLVFLILGVSWFLNSLGVFVKDIGQFVCLITTELMFLSPIFYPVDALPLKFQSWIFLNPLTFIIEQSREIIIWGHLPNFKGLIIYCIPALIIAFIGFSFFKNTKKVFADVV
jgi:lipopolysaccharide transport system permease protein